MRAIPGDVVTNLVGQAEVTPERLAELRRMFGLDLPVHVQFGQWLGAALQGDLGSSLRTGRSITGDLTLRFPVTLELTLLSLVVALALALPLGIAAALNRGRWPDGAASVFALLGLSVPGFFLGILLILLFSLRLGWLPPAGYVPFTEDPWQNLRHMLLRHELRNTLIPVVTVVGLHAPEGHLEALQDPAAARRLGALSASHFHSNRR